MTRAEYEAKYGVKPVNNTLDPSLGPAPLQMTRAEYEQRYNITKQPSPLAKAGNAINSVNPLFQIPKTVIEGAQKYGTGVGQFMEAKTPGEAAKGVLSATAGAGTAALAIPIGGFEAVTNLPGLKQVKNFLWGIEPGTVTLPNLVADKVADIKPLQDFVAKYQDSPEIAGDLITTILTGVGIRAGVKPKLQAELQAEYLAAYNKAKNVTVGKAPTETTPGSGVAGYLGERRIAQSEQVTQQRAASLTKIANSTGRKILTDEQVTKQNDSAYRIAETDVMSGVVNESGSIDPILLKDAIKAYEFARVGDIDKSLVKNLLIEEAKVRDTATNLGEIAARLTEAADRFSGSFRSSLDRAIEAEVRGMAKRADDFNKIQLEHIQQAKVNETNSLKGDYGVLSSNAKEWKKAKANVYKTLIEKNSQVKVPVNGKEYSIKEVNAELGKYMQDIAFMKSLSGRKVEGGRLGKHFASISGNIIGYAAGSMFGLVGGAVGSAMGGELARGLKGKQMKGAFGKDRGLPVKKNPILTEASNMKGQGVDLRSPDVKVRSPLKASEKTPAIFKAEKAIERNVEAQKKAIKQGDFSLVAALKEIYKHLVQHLKDLVKTVKETNKSRGFAKVGGYSKSEGSLKKQYSASKKATTKAIQEKTTTAAKTRQAISSDTTLADAVARELSTYDATPLTVNGKISLSSSIDDFRLAQLKQLSETKALTPAQVQEAAALLEKRGINPLTADTLGTSPLAAEAKKYKSAEEFVKAQEAPKTVKVWNQSKFSNDGAYADIPVTRKVDNITLYQGGSAEGRQFWTPDKKYAGSFGKVTEKTGTFYKVDNGNRVADVYVEAPTKSQLTDLWNKVNKK